MARPKLTPQDELNKKIIARNINNLIESKDVKQVDIHNHTDIPRSTLTGYVKGTSLPTPGNVQKLADYFGVLKSQIDPRFASDLSNIIRPSNDVVNIPILGLITCGNPILAEENIEGYKEEFSEFLPSGELFYLRTKGNSMVPVIPENSYVLIRKQEEVEDGEIAAVLVNGDEEATLKRVKYQNGMVLLLPENTDEHEPYIVTQDNPARIIGKAIKVSFDL